MTVRTIQNEQEFEIFMQEIDNLLRERNVSMHAREICALAEAAKLLGCALPGGPLRTGPLPGVYSGESLSAHIFQWIRQRYGNRLKIDFSRGYAAVLLKNDAWLLRIPLVYGSFHVICDRDLSKDFPTTVVHKPGIPRIPLVVNALKCVVDLPQGRANDLSDQDLMYLYNYFLRGHDFFERLSHFAKSRDLAESAFVDLKASARYAVSDSSEYGQSRWASLQAAEKLLKLFIQDRGERFPSIHALDKLAQQANSLGLPTLPSNLLDTIQCDAGIRYEKRNHRVLDVVAANQAALRAGNVILENLF